MRPMVTPTLLLVLAGISLGANRADAQHPSEAERHADGLRRMDANRNGMIEAHEIPQQLIGPVRGLGTKAGLDPNKPMSVDALIRALKPAEPAGDSSSGGDSDEETVPGFGELETVPGFADPPAALEELYDRRVIEYVDGRMLGRYDENRNGQLDAEEIPKVDWGDAPAQDDANKDGILNRAELASRIARRWGHGKKYVPPEPTVRGFDGTAIGTPPLEPLEARYDSRVLEYIHRNILGPHDRNRNRSIDGEELARVPWTDDWHQDDANGDGALSREELAARTVRRWKAKQGSSSGSTSGTSSSSSASSPAAKVDERTREFAQRAVRGYDKNRNGTLERDEWKRMRGDPTAADTNRDGKITTDELALHYARWRAQHSSSSHGSSHDRSRGSPSSSGKQPDRPAIRFRTPAERLPKGLPEWFRAKDLDFDGQVAMWEYADDWTAGLVAEFRYHDENHDGVITPAEAIATPVEHPEPEEKSG